MQKIVTNVFFFVFTKRKWYRRPLGYRGHHHTLKKFNTRFAGILFLIWYVDRDFVAISDPQIKYYVPDSNPVTLDTRNISVWSLLRICCSKIGHGTFFLKKIVNCRHEKNPEIWNISRLLLRKNFLLFHRVKIAKWMKYSAKHAQVRGAVFHKSSHQNICSIESLILRFCLPFDLNIYRELLKRRKGYFSG